MRKVLNWKQIRRSSEKELEKEIRKIANAYASRARVREKEFGNDMFEAAYGKRLTAKQMREFLVDESDGKYKYRRAYQKWKEFDINSIYMTKKEMTEKIRYAKDRYDRLEVIKAVELVRRENELMRNQKFLDKVKEMRGEVDLDNMSDVIRSFIEVDITNYWSTTDLARKEHEFDNEQEFKLWLVKEIQNSIL